MAPKPVSSLVGVGEPMRPFLVVDPGAKCGLARVAPTPHGGVYALSTLALDDLTNWLRDLDGDRYGELRMAFLVCEDYHLVGARARQQAGSPMPSARGIGMCQLACDWTDTPLFLAPPNCKRAGHMALDAAGKAAYAAARNDHERDAVDIAGFALREMRRPA